jgi:hypothetical protein
MRLTSTGLGIGTSSPDFKLDVEGADGVTARIKSTSGTTGNFAQLIFDSNNSFSGTGQAYIRGISTASGNSNTALAFGVNQSGFGAPYEAMRINESGNVGIGTVAPAYPLDVVSSAGAVGISLRGRSADNIGTFSFFTNNGVTNDAQLQMRPNDNELRFLVSGARFQSFYTNGSERMRIDASGSVNIGAATSDAKLVVSGGNATTGIVGRFVNPVSGGNAKIGFSDTLTYNWTIGSTNNNFTFINKFIYWA